MQTETGWLADAADEASIETAVMSSKAAVGTAGVAELDLQDCLLLESAGTG